MKLMEIACPSCASKHRTEDYPGAFEIQCACGYSILVPDEDALASSETVHGEEAPPPSFDDAPMALEEKDDAGKITLAPDEDDPMNPDALVAHHQSSDAAFSALDLTPPEELPQDMPYDPFELQTQWAENDSPANEKQTPEIQEPNNAPSETDPDAKDLDAQKPSEAAKSTQAQNIVDRIQMASIGYLHGPLFNISIKELPLSGQKSLKTHLQKFLDEHIFLREHLPKEYSDPSDMIQKGTFESAPELLAVEIYLFCAHHQYPCILSAHKN
jgi:hypothetical protein